MTDDLYNYLKEIMPDAAVPEVECVGCLMVFPIVTRVVREGQTFCSDSCADRKLAVMVCLSPKGTKVDGWDV